MNLIDYLPPFLQKSSVLNGIFTSEDQQLANLRLNIDDVKKQLSIDTATWGLVFFEKELGITTDLSKPLDERRSVIKSKWRGTGKVDATLIKTVVDAYTNGQVEVGFNGNITVKFTGIYGIPPNLDDAKKAVEDISPAHLRILYEFAYLLIKDIHGVMTLTEIEQTHLNKFAGGEV